MAILKPDPTDLDNPLPGENYDQFDQRRQSGLADQASQAQQAANDQDQRNQAATAKAYSSQGIASYNDSTGALKAITAVPGGPPLQGDGSNGGLVYGQDGSPQRVKFASLDNPTLVDAYSPEGGGSTQTDKAGNTYATSPGAPWKWTGTDPAVQKQAQADAQDAAFKEQKAALDEANGVFGQQVSQAKGALAGHQKALDANTAAIQGIPELASGDFDPDDPDAAKKLPSAFAPTDPQYNEQAGWFGGGGLSVAARQARSDLAQRQQQAQTLLTQRQQTQAQLDRWQSVHDTAAGQLSSVLEQRATLARQRLQGDNLPTGSADDDAFNTAQAAANAPAGTAASQTNPTGNTPALAGTAGTPGTSAGNPVDPSQPSAPLQRGSSVIYNPTDGPSRTGTILQTQPGMPNAIVRHDADLATGLPAQNASVPVAYLQHDPTADPNDLTAPMAGESTADFDARRASVLTSRAAAQQQQPPDPTDLDNPMPGESYAQFDQRRQNGLAAQTTSTAANDLTQPMPGESAADFQARVASVGASRAAAGATGAAPADPDSTSRTPAKPYSVGTDGKVQFDPANPTASVLAAFKDGAIDGPTAQASLDAAKRVEAAHSDLTQFLQDHPQIAAAAEGLSTGGAFYGGGKLAVAGAQAAGINPAILAASSELGPFAWVPPAIATGAEFVGGGMLASWAKKKAEQRLGEYTDAVQALQSGAQAYPKTAAAAQFLPMLPEAAASMGGFARMAGVAADDLGAAATTGQKIAAGAAAVGKQAAVGAAGGAAVEGVLRPALSYSADAVLDAAGIKHDPTEAPTVGSVVQMAGLGALTAGQGVDVTKVSDEQMGSILVRGSAHETANVPFHEVIPPDQVAARYGAYPNMTAADMANIGQPLTPAEQELYTKAQTRLDQLYKDGTLTGRFTGTAQQATRSGQPIGVTSFDFRPRADGGSSGGNPSTSPPLLSGGQNPESQDYSSSPPPVSIVPPAPTSSAPPVPPSFPVNPAGTSSASPASTPTPPTGQAATPPTPAAPAQNDQRDDGQAPAPAAFGPAPDAASDGRVASSLKLG